MTFPDSVRKHAAAHYGLVTSKVLAEGDLSGKQVRGRVANGLLVRVHQGVFRVATTPETWEQQVLAACLATGGVASHTSAKQLWTPSGSRVDPTSPVEVTVPRSSAPKPPQVTVHRSGDMDVESCPRRRKIPVTTPMRMLIDLGAVVDAEEVAATLARCVSDGLFPLAALRNELQRTATQGRAGVSAVRRVVRDWPLDETVRPGSPLEVAFARLCREAGLPPPVPQHTVVLAGERRKLDCAYPDRRIAIELDGFEAHSTHEAFQDDRSRQNELIRAGWQILRFTWQDVTHRSNYVVRTVSGLLAEPLPV